MTTSILKAIFKRLPGNPHLPQLFRLESDFLLKSGWNKSASERKPQDGSGNPIPWLTYSCIHFLQDRLRDDLTIFEFGSGNSTLWFSQQCKAVVSVEHDKEWFDYIGNELKARPNVTYLYKDLDSGAYVKSIGARQEQFDLVLIDGRERVACCKSALPKLKERGVMIWDNSDRDKYQEGFDFLNSQGFKKLDFFGLSPGSKTGTMTSVFYKPDNCLGI